MKKIPMSFDEYHMLPQNPALRVEYCDGCAVFTARNQPVTVTIPVERKAADTELTIRPLEPGDTSGLAAAFRTAFHGTIDFYELSEADLQDRAEKRLLEWFEQATADMALASRVAVDSENRVVAAALLLRHRTGPHLDMLFVRPEWQRRGVATALVCGAMNSLADQTESRLSSFYDVGNRPSEAWHRAFGFVEEPDLLVARLRWRSAAHEVWRQEKLREMGDADFAELKRQAETMEAQVKRLEAIQGRGGFEAVAPLLRFQR